VLHGVVAVGVVGLVAALPAVHELRSFLEPLLNHTVLTSASHPISWLEVWGTFHLSLGVWVTVLSLSLMSEVSSVL